MNEKGTILVVDDDPALLELSTRILEKAGYEVLAARTGKECFDAVRSLRPHLVLLDVMLPDGMGTDVCRSIKADPGLKNTFILLASGVMTSSDYQADGLNCGADGYITKPISNKELLARVQAMERIRRSEEALEHARDELEERVKERTRELSEANRLLVREIAERKAAARALKKSEERLRYLTNHLQKIVEKERALLSREIHDELGQILTVIKMDATLIGGLLSYENKPIIERMNELVTYADNAIGAVQRISAALRPPVPGNFGLTRAITAAADDFQKRTGIVCEVHKEAQNTEPGGETGAEVFRIFQESLTNIARHAQAHKAVITLKIKRNKYMMEVKDDGRGITRKEIAEPRSIGLTGMRERAGSVGGTLKIEGLAKKGTTVTLTVPLDRRSEDRRGKGTPSVSQLAGV